MPKPGRRSEGRRHLHLPLRAGRAATVSLDLRMDGEAHEKVIAMHVSRLRNSSREEPEAAPVAESGKTEPELGQDRGGGAPDSAPAAQAESTYPGAGPECFDLEDSDYKAFGWAGNKTLPTLVIILKDGSSPVVNYCDLASAIPGGSMFLASAPGCKGNVIRLLVAGVNGVFLVVIEGLRLWRVWLLIMAHKTPWIREMPDGMGFATEREAVIHSISIVEPQQLAATAAAGRR